MTFSLIPSKSMTGPARGREQPDRERNQGAVFPRLVQDCRAVDAAGKVSDRENTPKWRSSVKGDNGGPGPVPGLGCVGGNAVGTCIAEFPSFPGLAIGHLGAKPDGKGVEVVLGNHDSVVSETHRCRAGLVYCRCEVDLERLRILAGDFEDRVWCSHLLSLPV